MEGVALDLLGNYTVQSLLEATHKLRSVAHSMAQQVHGRASWARGVGGCLHIYSGACGVLGPLLDNCCPCGTRISPQLRSRGNLGGLAGGPVFLHRPRSRGGAQVQLRAELWWRICICQER
jgi:hypothetical protein